MAGALRYEWWNMVCLSRWALRVEGEWWEEMEQRSGRNSTLPSVLGRFRGASEEGVVGPDLSYKHCSDCSVGAGPKGELAQ